MRNEKVTISYDEERKCISGADLTDVHNEPRFYTTSKRGLTKAWADLQLLEGTPEFETMSMYEVVSFLSDHGVHSHTYCSVD